MSLPTVHCALGSMFVFFFFSVGDWLSLISKGNIAYSKEIEFDASDQS